MTTASRPQSSVTLLHKGLGPSLFQFESKPFPVSEREGASGSSPRSPVYDHHRSLRSPPSQPRKRVVVKCVERQDANSMFEKRLRERAARHYRPPTGTAAKIKAPGQQQPECQLYIKERLFTNAPHKPSGFPPPNFMPRWNPRHKDRTYLSKMVLEDPWSLPAEKRAELKAKTGLRLKSISRHYQYKLANLPFGKEADGKCTCHVEFCDHCSKSHDYRCPLHMQLLDAFQPDCKTELGEFCPFARNPEDLPLEMIKDPGVYVSEVVRRLKAGELRDVPLFPSKFLIPDNKLGNLTQKNIPASAEASTEALDNQKKAIVEDSCTQTEPFIVDVDMKAAYKENMSQTKKPEKEEPMMLNSILKSIGGQNHYKPCPPNLEAATQVTPCLIQTFEQRAETTVLGIAKQTLKQALQEISDELRLEQIQTFRAEYTQQLVDLQRTAQFKYLQEKWRNNAYVDEQFEVEREMVGERSGERAVCAIGFTMSFFWNFPGKVLEGLRREGFIVNEDLKAMNTVVRDDLNMLMEERLRRRDESVKLLDEMINHALLDLEMDAFRAKLVDAKYLDPLNLTTRFLREMIAMRDNNFEMMRRIRGRLFAEGWHINENGELVRWADNSPDSLSSSSSSEVSLDAFLKGVRVSVDSEGNPKYLVDIRGKPLPINVRWIPVLEEAAEKYKSEQRGRNSWRFDIVLDEKSLSDTQSATNARGSMKKRSTKGDGVERAEDVEREGEGLGLDFDYLGAENYDDDGGDDDEGRLVFKRKDDSGEDYNEFENDMDN